MKRKEKISEGYRTFRKTSETTKYAFKFVWNEKKGKSYVFLKFFMAVINALIPLVSIICPV